MKIRMGFVSNSSSSSFYVAFKNIPKDAEELRQWMFGDEQKVKTTWSFQKEERYTDTIEFAEVVYKEMMKQINGEGDITFSDEIMMCIEVGGDIDKIMDRFYPNIREEDSDKWWKYYEKMEAIQDGEDGSELKEKYPDHKIFSFCYADGCGWFQSFMEHGGIFNNFPHERISHH